MSDLTDDMPDRLPVPYSSPGARAYAAEDIFRGEQSLFHPELFKKDEAACPLSDLLFEIGKASGRERIELHDAHDAIPNAVAPRTEGTLGEKTPLADRVRVLLATIDRQQAEIEALKATHDARVTELLAANNREVERRRVAEAELARTIREINEEFGI